MKRAWLVLGVMGALAAGPAYAKTGGQVQAVTPLPKATQLADNVVVTPGQSQPAPAATTNVQTAPAPAAQPVAVDSGRQTHTHADVSPPKNYMSTVAVSALMGGLAGALIGGAIYFLDNDRNNPENVAYWAAGGVLVGTGVGVTQVLVQESRASAAVSRLDRLPSDPAPTFKIALLRQSF